MGAVELKEKINIKQNTETFILSKSRNRRTASRNHTAFIVLFRMTSSEEGTMGGGYRVCLLFYKLFYYFKSHLAGRRLSFYSDL